MQKIKISHISDVHLGSAYTGLPYDKSKLRSKESIHTFIKAIDEAADCDVLLLSGDIFDSGNISLSIADLFLSSIEALGSTQVFFACGNHDSYYTDIIKYCLQNAPDNLFIFPPEKIFSVTIESKKTRIYGVSFSGEHQYESLFNTMPKCDSDYINILCMHADVLSNQYNPLNVSQLSQSNLDYVALGHIHEFGGINKIENCFYAYSGVLEGRGFDECGTKGYLKGFVSKNTNELKFYPCAKREYIDETVDISDFNSEYDLIDVMNSICDSKDNICRFTFVGTNNFEKPLDTVFLTNQCDCFWCICIDNTKTKVTLDEYAGYPGLLGECAVQTQRLINSSVSDEETEKYKKAFELLTNIFENK